jgi:hypothetical protein
MKRMESVIDCKIVPILRVISKNQIIQKTCKNALKCFEMLQNASECLKKFQN